MYSTGSLRKRCLIRTGFAISPCIRTRSSWLYLAAVLDLHSRKIVGWAMSRAMPAALVCAALQMVIAQRNPAPGLIVHADRGMQYASAEHQALLAKHGLVGSMISKANCWDTQYKISFRTAFDLTRAGICRKTMQIMQKQQTILLTTLLAFTTASGCTQNWATCHPTLSSVSRHQKNLSSCPKLLDHHMLSSLFVTTWRTKRCFFRIPVQPVLHDTVF